MSKTKRKWLELEYNNNGSVRAEDIPYDATYSIKDKLDEETAKSGTFTNTDLNGSYQYTFNHGLDSSIMPVVVKDNNDEVIIPDKIEYIDANNVRITLTGEAPITGTWTISVIKSGVSANAGGGIKDDDEKTDDYTILTSDDNHLLTLGRGTAANKTFTLYELSTNKKKSLYFKNDNDYILTIQGYEKGTDACEAGTTHTIINATSHGFLAGQILEMTSGDESGESRRITSVTANTITLDLPLSGTPSTSETFSVRDAIDGEKEYKLEKNDQLTLYGSGEQTDIEWIAVEKPEHKLVENKTVYLGNTMSSANIQTLINKQPKNLGGKTLTFQFANGTYTVTSTMIWNNFYSGNLYIYGDTTISSLSTSQSVFLNGSATNTNIIHCYHNTCFINIKGFKIARKTDVSWGSAIRIDNYHSFVRYNYIYGNGITNGCVGIYIIFSSNTYVYNNYVSNIQYGIHASECGRILSQDNADTGTRPQYGLKADTNGVIGKRGTQPSGSTGNETTSNGGVIR